MFVDMSVCYILYADVIAVWGLTSFSVRKSFRNFAQSTTVVLSCSHALYEIAQKALRTEVYIINERDLPRFQFNVRYGWISNISKATPQLWVINDELIKYSFFQLFRPIFKNTYIFRF